VLLSSAAALAAAPLPAFPGAEGFGALATGGRGGSVVHVTTLADAGPGSLREAVSQPGRIVVFDISGTIKLASNLVLANDLTVAGQTAFAGEGKGITVYNKSVSLSDKHNIILRYIRFRQGIQGDRGKCSINCSNAGNIVIDHCSIEWGRWDCLGLTQGTHDVSLQYCMIGEGLDPQQFGALVDSVENVTISHNLWINNHSRNPKAKGTIQYINNVVYNWQITGLCGGHSAANHTLDVIGNYFVRGPHSNQQAIGQCTATDHIFQSGNFVDLNLDGQLNGRAVTEADFKDKGGSPTIQQAPWAAPALPVTVDSAEIAYQKVAGGAGASLLRDAVDTRLIMELGSLGKQGHLVKNEGESGGLPEVAAVTIALPDADHDGMPDAWEAAHHLESKDASDAAKVDASGYANIELYLNSLAR
jgi:pectate lyase